MSREITACDAVEVLANRLAAERPSWGRITISEHSHSRTILPAKDESGAYLLVLNGTASAHKDLQRRAHYPGDITCGADDHDVRSTAGCSPPPGFDG